MNNIILMVLSEDILENLINIAGFIVIVAAIHHFFGHFFKETVTERSYVFLAYIAYYIISSIFYLIPIPGYVRIIINLIGTISLSFLYQTDNLWRVVASAIVVALILISNGIAQIAVSFIFSGSNVIHYLIRVSLARILLLAFTGIATLVFTSFGSGQMAGRHGAIMILFPISTCSAVYIMAQNPLLQQNQLLFLSIIIILAMLNFFVFLFLDRNLSWQETEKRAILMEQQIEIYTNQHRLMEAVQKNTIKIRHDIKNVLLGLQTELEAGRLAESKQILEELIGDFGSTKDMVHSGNLVIDSIINYQQHIANLSAVRFILDLRFPADIVIDTTAICVILGNALENAIEACQGVAVEQRRITIQIHHEHESLFIRIENPYTGEIETDRDGRIKTKKSDQENHGIGLTSMEDMIITRQKGLINISFAAGLFQLEVVLFNVKRSQRQ